MKFVYYNDYSFLRNQFSFYQMLATIFVSFPICRVDKGYLNKKFCLLDLSYNDLLFRPCSYTIEEILDIVGIELLSRNREIFVCCSGGIDSTCILTSLLKNSDRGIGVLFNKYSVEENKNFFSLLANNKRVSLQECTLSNIDFLLSTGALVVTGTPADIIIEPHIKKEYDNTRWKDYLYRKLFDDFFVLDKYKNKECLDDFVKYAEYICSYSPIPIFSVKDFWWWIGLSTMYNGLHYIWHCTTSDIYYPTNFYDHQLFIDYSVTNHVDNKKRMSQYNLDYFKSRDAILFSKKKSSKMLAEYEDNLVCISSTYKKIIERHDRYEYSVRKYLHYKKMICQMK